jgi:Xaa-Pro dipeptidase
MIEPFNVMEFENRVMKVRQKMLEINIELFIISEMENIFYLTNYQTVGKCLQCLILTNDDLYIITRRLEESNMERSVFKKSFSYTDNDDDISKLIDIIKTQSDPKGNIGIENESLRLNYNHHEQLREHFTNFVDCSNIIGQFRVIKSELELDAIKESAKITESAANKAIEFVREGVTEDQIAAQAYYHMMMSGGEYPAYPAFITSGPRGVMGHSTNEHRVIENGDLVFMEIGGCYRRYHTAVMRTCYIGDVLPDWLQEAEIRLNTAIKAGQSIMKPGTKAYEVDKIMRDELSKCSFNCEQSTRSGYSIGIGFYTDWGEKECFEISASEEQELEENMVIHLIPWLTVEGKGGIGMSETIVVTKYGPQQLFDVPQKIFCK